MKHTRAFLKNGVCVITVPMLGNPTVTVFVAAKTGSFHETANVSGLSHFLEHMCFKGTVRRPNSLTISTELDAIGAHYNAFTDTDVTAFYAKSDTKHFKVIGDVISDVYLNSTFPQGEIEKEKGVVLGEIDMYADDNQQKVVDAMRVSMYKGEPAEFSVIGNKETVSRLSREDLVAYRDRQYVGSNTVVVVAGGLEEKDMALWAEFVFGSMKSGEPHPEARTVDRTQTGPETVYLEKDTDQAHLICSWRTWGYANPNRFVMSVIRTILAGGMSSRLFTKLREELGSGYYINAGSSAGDSFGNFSISTGTSHTRVPEIVEAIMSETQRLKNTPVSDEEIARAKEIIRSGRLMGLESSDDVAEFFALQEAASDTFRTPEEIDRLISAVSAEDIQRVACMVFDPKKLTCAVIGQGIDMAAVSKALNA